jgi:predicted RNase H-like nuclease (RuvC/YqgF family)
MKLENRFGGTLVSTTDDIIDLLRGVFDEMSDPKELKGLEQENDKQDEEIDELKHENKELRTDLTIANITIKNLEKELSELKSRTKRKIIKRVVR